MKELNSFLTLLLTPDACSNLCYVL